VSDSRKLARHTNALISVNPVSASNSAISRTAPESMAMFAFDFPLLVSLAPKSLTSLMFIPFYP
jgi:hypothetical protein